MKPSLLSVDITESKDEITPISPNKISGNSHSMNTPRRQRRVSFSADEINEFHKKQPVRTPTAADLRRRNSITGSGTKTILKRRLSIEDISANELKLAQEEKKSNKFKKKLINLCKDGGAQVDKVCSTGELEARFFWFTEDCSKLRWRKTPAPAPDTPKRRDSIIKIASLSLKKPHKSEKLASTLALVYGWPGLRRVDKPWLCFTVVFPKIKPLRLRVNTVKEVDIWFLGLQTMVPMCQYYMEKPKLLWTRMQWKLREEAKKNRKKFESDAFMRNLYKQIVQKKYVSTMFQPVASKTPKGIQRQGTKFIKSRKNNADSPGNLKSPNSTKSNDESKK